MALARAVQGVKARGGVVLLVAHRRGILATVDLVLLIRGGAAQAFGPRDDVLAQIAKPAPRPASKGGNITVLPKRN